MKEVIESAWTNRDLLKDSKTQDTIRDVIEQLDKGKIRVADDFCGKLKEKFLAVKIDRIDEFYTSKLAHRTMISSGINKTARRDKALVDKISATILLQNYLDKI